MRRKTLEDQQIAIADSICQHESWIKQQVEQEAACVVIQTAIRRQLAIQVLQVAQHIEAKKREEAILEAQRELEKKKLDGVVAIQSLIRRRIAADALQQLKQERAEDIKREAVLLQDKEEQELRQEIRAQALERVKAARAEFLKELAQPQRPSFPQRTQQGVVGQTQEERELLQSIRHRVQVRLMDLKVQELLKVLLLLFFFCYCCSICFYFVSGCFC